MNNPARIATLLAIALAILALSLLLGGKAGAAVTRTPSECSYPLAREICCHPVRVVYERRPNPDHAEAAMQMCWGSLGCPGISPDAVAFCSLKKVLNP